MLVQFCRDGETQQARVATIDRCRYRGDLFGERVTELRWADRELAILLLDTGDFCHGSELV